MMSAIHDMIEPVSAQSNFIRSKSQVLTPSARSMPAPPPSATTASSSSKSRGWWIDFILVCLVLALAESARGIVIVESLSLSAVELSMIVSVFSVGRLFASFVFGWLSDYFSVRALLIACLVACIIGDALYCFAGTIGLLWLIIVSRLLTGFGTGSLSVARTFVSVTSPPDERTLWMAWLGIVQFIGFVITPALAGVSIHFNVGALKIDSNTLASYALLLLEILVCALLYFFMSRGKDTSEVRILSVPPPLTVTEENENDIAPEQLLVEEKSADTYYAMNDNAHTINISTNANAAVVTDDDMNNSWCSNFSCTSLYYWFVNNRIALWFVILNLITRGSLGVAETFGTPLFIKSTTPDGDIEPTAAGMFFLILGFVGTLLFLFTNRLTRWFREVDLLIFSVLIMVVGFIICIDYGSMDDWHIPISLFSVSMLCIWSLGTPISQTLVVSMLSKRIDKKNAGAFMGAITAAGAISRIVYPPIAGLIYSSAGESWALVFPAASLIVATLITIYALDAYTLYFQWINRSYTAITKCGSQEQQNSQHPNVHAAAAALSVNTLTRSRQDDDESIESEDVVPEMPPLIQHNFAAKPRLNHTPRAGARQSSSIPRGISSQDVL